MWPLIIGTVVGAAALAYLLWRLFRRRQRSGETPQPSNNEGSNGVHGGFAREDRRPSPEELRHQLLGQIAANVKFSHRIHRVPIDVPTGKRVETRLPTSDVDIQPVRTTSDLLRVGPSMQSLDDDAFFGRYAGGNLSRPAFMEPETRVEYQEVPNAKVLLVLADLSGSMRENFRASWMRQLVRLLAERSEKEKARFVLIPFTDRLHRKVIAESTEEYAQLYRYISSSLLIDGGTDIDMALFAGIEYLMQEKLTDGRIVLITDGDDNVALQQIAEALKSADAKLVTVAMATQRRDLGTISEQIYSVN